MCCVLCLRTTADTSAHIEIFSSRGRSLEVQNTIEKHFWLEFSEGTPKTHFICQDCWNNLYSFHQFYLSVAKVHQMLNYSPELAPTEELTTDEINIKVEIDAENHEYEISNEYQCSQMDKDADVVTNTNSITKSEEDINMCGYNDTGEQYPTNSEENNIITQEGLIIESVCLTESCKRKKYRRNTPEDRDSIMAAAANGQDWIALAASLGVAYKTAWCWIHSGRKKALPKGGNRPKKLSEDQISQMLTWLETNSKLTLTQMAHRIQTTFNTTLTCSSVGNYLDGRIYTSKVMPSTLTITSSEDIKEKHSSYIAQLNAYMQAGKKIMWMDETNLNLFCRNARSRGRRQTVEHLPAAKRLHVYLLAAITSAGVVAIERFRTSLNRKEICNAWLCTVLKLFQQQGNNLADLVIYCDSAFCPAILESAVANYSADKSIVLRLDLHSSMYNPFECLWSKIKNHTQANIELPKPATQCDLIEQHLIYLERLTDDAKSTINKNDCEYAINEINRLYEDVIPLQDTPLKS